MASIIVVGGGLAGRACAWKLRRAGHEVELLDRASVTSDIEAWATEDAGALTTADSDVLAAAAVLDIPVRTGAADSDAFLCSGSFEPLPAPTLGNVLRATGGSRGRRLRFLRRMLLPVRRGDARPSSLADHDGASLEAVLSAALGDDPLVASLGALAGLSCGESPARLSHATGIAALAARAARPLPVFLEGGLTGLRAALAREVTARPGCEVVDVETESAGARVRYRTQGRLRSVLADAAVIALPAPDLLRCCPKLTPDERGFFEAVETAPCLTLGLVLEGPPPLFPWHRAVFPGAEATLRSLVSVHRDPELGSTGRGLLAAQLATEWARRLVDAPDAEVEQTVLAALADTPLGRLRPRAVSVTRRASPRLLFRPGAVERIARFDRRMERSPRLAFAGRHLLGPGPGAALTSGLRAATIVARAL